jgi:hypothetical protein
MKVHEMFKMTRDPPTNPEDPLYEIHLDLTQMTDREFMNAMTLIDDIRLKFDVVLKGTKDEIHRQPRGAQS